MDLVQLANLGEAIGGFAVVISVIYLAYELRTSTRVLRASKAAISSENWSSFNQAMLQDNVMLEITMKVWADKLPLNELETIEQFKFDYYCRAIMQLCEAEYLLCEQGIHAKDVYNNRITNVKRWMQLPAWSEWWEREQHASMYSDDFLQTIFGEVDCP